MISPSMQAWQAWSEGINGHAAIRNQEENGVQWRAGASNLRKRVDEFKLVVFLILARAERLKLSPSAAAAELQSHVLDVYKLRSLRALRD